VPNMSGIHAAVDTDGYTNSVEGKTEHESGPRLFLNMFLLLQFFLLIYILVIVRLSGIEAVTVLVVSLTLLAVGLYFIAKQIIDRF